MLWETGLFKLFDKPLMNTTSFYFVFQEQEELMQELSSMPIRNDTTRIRRHREEVEQKLSKIEEAIKIFSRSKVFVKLESWWTEQYDFGELFKRLKF